MSKRIVRINSDGSIDPSFNIGTGFNGFVYAIRVQADGKILCGGSFNYFNGASCSNVVRLLPDGSLDPDFAALAFAPSFTKVIAVMAASW